MINRKKQAILAKIKCRLNQNRAINCLLGLSKGSNRKVMQYVVKNRVELHDGDKDGRTTILVELEASDGRASFYMPGDHLGVYPENRKQIVDGILGHLSQYDADQEYQIFIKNNQIDESADDDQKWVLNQKLSFASLREALTRYLDITTPPTQQILALFAVNATNTEDRVKLQVLATDSSKYEQWKAQNYPNLWEVLKEFRSVLLPIELILTQLPTLQSRFYSISSSPLMHSSSRIDLTVAVVKYLTNSGVEHFGVCSNHLNQIPIGHSVYAFIRSAPNFRLPEDKTVPLIMVGPGSGIAPFRGFWQHRARMVLNRRDESNKFGKMTLFFGCRSPSMQLHCKEVQQMVDQGVIYQSFVAYSRVPGQPKVSHLYRFPNFLAVKANRKHFIGSVSFRFFKKRSNFQMFQTWVPAQSQ